jgi:hypothetical protein
MGKANSASFALKKSMSLSYASQFSEVGLILRYGMGLGLRDDEGKVELLTFRQ